MKPRPKPVEYLIIGLCLYLLSGVIWWSRTAFSYDFEDTIRIFVLVFLGLGTLSILLAIVSRLFPPSKPND